MRSYLTFYLLLCTLIVRCVEEHLPHFEDNPSFWKVKASLLPQGIPQAAPPEYLTAPAKDEVELSCDTICRDNKVHTQPVSETSSAATNLRHHDFKFRPLRAPLETSKNHDIFAPTMTPWSSMLSADTASVPRRKRQSSFYHSPTHVATNLSTERRPTVGDYKWIHQSAKVLDQRAKLPSQGFLQFFHETSGMALESARQLLRTKNRIKSLELPAKVVAGFPKAQELQEWFQMVVLTTAKDGEPQISRALRRNIVESLADFEDAYRPLTLSGFESHQRRELTFMNASYFGRRCLRSFSHNDTTYSLGLLFEILDRRMTMMRIPKHDYFNQLFLWPVIIAGSKEWSLQEAFKFSRYLRYLEPREFKSAHEEPSKNKKEVGDYMTFQEQSGYEHQTRLLANILGENEIESKQKPWMEYYGHIIKEENYYLINSRIEEAIHTHFHEELKDYHGKKLFIPQEKLEAYALKWQIKEQNLLILVRLCVYSCKGRGRYTMSYQLSNNSMSYFSDKLLDLAREILSKKKCKTDLKDENEAAMFLEYLYQTRKGNKSAISKGRFRFQA